MVLAITFAISGLHHGFFEILQGNKPTNNLIIQSISIEYQHWKNGEEAFSLIPNYLLTGISAILVSLLIIINSIILINKSYYNKILLLLFVVLTMVGGGIAHVVFFIPMLVYSTRRNKELKIYKKILPEIISIVAAKIWKYLLIIASLCFIIAIEISVFGIYGLKDDRKILSICWSFLFSSLVFINLTYISGIAKDIKDRIK